MGLLKSLETKRQVGALRSEDRQVRQRAAERLGELGDASAVGPLIAALNDAVPGVRQAALGALGKIGDSRAIGPIVGGLTDDSAPVREAAATALNEINPAWPRTESAQRAANILVAALNHKNADVRRIALMVLGKMGASRLIEPVIGSLASDSPSLREAAAKALDEIDPNWRHSPPAQKAAHSLIVSLANADAAVRQAAQKTLSEVNPDWAKSESAKKAVPGLIDTLRHSHDYYDLARKHAAEALGKIALNLPESQYARQTIDTLVSLLRDTEASARSHAAGILESLGWAPTGTDETIAYCFGKGRWDELSRLGQPAIDYVSDLMSRGDGDTQSMAAQALSTIGGSGAIKALVACLQEGDRYSQRRIAADALSRIGGTEVIETLVDCLSRGDYPQRTTAAEVLHRVDPDWRKSPAVQKAIPALLAALRNKEWEEGQQAALALGAIGDNSIGPQLLEGLCDDDENYASGCVRALGLLQHEEAVKPLVEKLADCGGPSQLTGVILEALGDIETSSAQAELIIIMKGGGDFCKGACDILNRGKKAKDEYVLCPACKTFLGLRKDVLASGSQITNEMRKRYGRLETVGAVLHLCPGCGDQILIS